MSAASPPDLLLPEGTRLLHIGPQKTGTTGIQVAMHRCRDVLREHGVVYPGTSTRPRRAVWSLVGTPHGRPRPPIRHWERLVREVEEAGDARVCLSTEDWARLDHDDVRRTVEGLGGDRAHVVGAARRLDRLLPSQWQQLVKMRDLTLGYEQWLEAVLGDDHRHPRWQAFWRPHDIRATVERWATAAGGLDRFTLVVADEGDRQQLPRTFEQMLGLPAGLLSSAVTDVRNQSIGFARAEGIRHLTQAFNEHGWRDGGFMEALLGRLADGYKVSVPWPGETGNPSLPSWALGRVRELGEQRAEEARSLGVRVVGDPDHLRAPDDLPTVDDLGTGMVSSELSAFLLERAIGMLLEQQADREATQRQKIARLRSKVHNARAVDQVSGRELVAELGRRARRRARRRRSTP